MLLTSSSSLREARGTAEVKPALRFVAAMVCSTVKITEMRSESHPDEGKKDDY